MFERGGRRIGLSPARRFIVDLMSASDRVPTIPMERRMNLAKLAQMRNRGPVRFGWCALFVQAYARVAARTPELRRVFLPWPWPHLYEHPKVIANIAVERQYGGEPVVLFGILHSPEQGPLTRTQAYVDHLKNDPVPEVRPFRRALRFARLPWPLRRILWRGVLDVSGEQRAKTLGNFGISAVAATGASQLWIRSPLTTTLYYGPFDSSHSLDVRLVFDHRVIDGAFAGRVLAELEAALCDEMPAEIAGGSSAAA
ncbi:MAG TPA: hypothetical protein VHR72_06735 [Gemmataceae bacterium]|jgi:hypothetical protein|nr:hypothetical protein [Gemmataceae bacterium]